MNAQQVWRKEVIRHYSYRRESIPVMLLGLKRDLRVENEDIIYPQEVSVHKKSGLERGTEGGRRIV